MALSTPGAIMTSNMKISGLKIVDFFNSLIMIQKLVLHLLKILSYRVLNLFSWTKIPAVRVTIGNIAAIMKTY